MYRVLVCIVHIGLEQCFYFLTKHPDEQKIFTLNPCLYYKNVCLETKNNPTKHVPQVTRNPVYGSKYISSGQFSHHLVIKIS